LPAKALRIRLGCAGNLLPGWPAATGGYVLSAPSVGDIDGDGKLEVIVAATMARSTLSAAMPAR